MDEYTAMEESYKNGYDKGYADAIGVLDQVRWERDVAIKQLEEHGIPFGGIAPDVVKVVRCKDCKCGKRPKTAMFVGKFVNCALYDPMPMMRCNDFCSYGERREGE